MFMYYKVSQGQALVVTRPGKISVSFTPTLVMPLVNKVETMDISLKTIGDYMGHRTAVATGVYAKIDIEALREVALGDGEAVL